MTLFFDFSKLQHDNPKVMLERLRKYYDKRTFLTPKSKDWLPGISFILNPKPILYPEKFIDPEYLAQYIELASKRDYSLYKRYKFKGLHLSYYPDIILDNIKTNPILDITNTHINFYYEEKIKEI